MSTDYPTEPRRYLIAIGSPYCPATGSPSLLRVESDVRKVTDLFEKQGYESVFLPLISETASQISDRISTWFARRDFQASDCVVIYYAGHAYCTGHAAHDDRERCLNEHYLLTIDSKLEELPRTAILTQQWVRTFFQRPRDQAPRNILLILDTCYAYAGARDIDRLMSQIKGETPDGSGFWIICSSDAATEAGDGTFVDALCKVMDPEWQEFQNNPEDFIAIDRLVQAINQQLQNRQQVVASAQEITRKAIFIRNPHRVSAKASSSTGLGNLSSQLVECLWSLDYKSQSQVFTDSTALRSRRAAAFVVQATDERVQSWLVKRLFQQLPNVKNAQVFSFVIPAHPMWKNRDFNELWVDLAQRLRCPIDPDLVLNRLVELYKTKPVILVMYGWGNSDRSRTLQAQVFRDFWQLLVAKVTKLDDQPIRSRLILFLAEASTTCLEQHGESDNLIRLAPLLEISSDDVTDWLESDRVYSALNQVMNSQRIDALIKQEISEWDTDPIQTLQQICYTFDLQYGISEIESEWRLVG